MHLPHEIFADIAELLAAEHRPSLYSCSLANRALNRAARPWILNTVKFQVTGLRKLRKDIDVANQILILRDGFQLVRCLDINGFMEDSEPDEAELDAAASWELNDDNYYGEDEIYGPDEYGDSVLFPDGLSTSVSEKEDRQWAPLAQFLKSVSLLTNLNWKCDNQFPPCLLGILHNRHPRCKLAIRKFRFRSLRNSVTDPHELVLATSPCLHEVGIRFTWRDSNGDEDYNLEACLQMISSMAPNLKSVRMLQCRPASSARLMRMLGTPRKPWVGFKPAQNASGQARLLSLELVSSMDVSDMLEWSSVTDFRTLRCLKISFSISADMMRMLDSFELTMLRELSIRLEKRDDATTNAETEEAAICMLSNIRPLQLLSLHGSISFATFSAAVMRHGPVLSSLSLTPRLASLRQIEQGDQNTPCSAYVELLADRCPVLTDLTITVKRMKSGLQEAKVYQSLGRLARLRTLFLTLDCSDIGALNTLGAATLMPALYKLDEQYFDIAAGRELPKGPLPDSFINSAVDENLARSICNMITSSHPTQSRLKVLKIATSGGLHFGYNNSYQMDQSQIVGHLSRSYRLERALGDANDEFSLTELGRRAREARDEQEREFERRIEQPRSSRPESYTMKIFRQIWPPREEGSGDWRDDWYSFPLQLE